MDKQAEIDFLVKLNGELLEAFGECVSCIACENMRVPSTTKRFLQRGAERWYELKMKAEEHASLRLKTMDLTLK